MPRLYSGAACEGGRTPQIFPTGVQGRTQESEGGGTVASESGDGGRSLVWRFAGVQPCGCPNVDADTRIRDASLRLSGRSEPDGSCTMHGPSKGSRDSTTTRDPGTTPSS